MQTTEFLVIGAGIAGLTAACALAEAGRVVVVERESQPGYHASGRSAALFTETYGPPPVRALTKASRRFFEERAEGRARQPLLSPRGVLFTGTADQQARLDHDFAEARHLSTRVERWDAAATRARAPMLRPEAAVGSVWEPDAADLDVYELQSAALRGLKARGGRLVVDAEVTALAPVAGGWEVASRAGRFTAPVVVNAAGAWADEVARLAGVLPLGLSPKRRTALLFDPVFAAPAIAAAAGPIAGWPMVIDADERFYFKPEAGRVLGSPADATPVAPCDVQPEELDIAEAVERIEAVAEFRIPRLGRRWAGLRSFMPDGVPVAGFEPHAPGLFWLAGQGGYGIQTAPAMAAAAAALILNRAWPTDLSRHGLTPAALAPDRLRGCPRP